MEDKRKKFLDLADYNRRIREETEKEKRMWRARMEVEEEFRTVTIIKYELTCSFFFIGSIVYKNKIKILSNSTMQTGIGQCPNSG